MKLVVEAEVPDEYVQLLWKVIQREVTIHSGTVERMYTEGEL